MIPKIFHHTWPSGGELKPKFIKYIESFKKFHPEYKFMFWTMDDLDKFALSDLSKTIQSPKFGLPWIALSDIMRYEILYKFGGIYLDTDVECLKNFDCFLENESFAAYSSNGVGNAVIGSVPQNPLFKTIATLVVQAAIKFGAEAIKKAPDKTIGVNLAGKLLNGVQKKYPQEYFYPFNWNDIKRNIGKQFPNSYAVHWWSGMDPDGWVKLKLK
jgi:mannosyltransferase OCH1-like enzyme